MTNLYTWVTIWWSVGAAFLIGFGGLPFYLATPDPSFVLQLIPQLIVGVACAIIAVIFYRIGQKQPKAFATPLWIKTGENNGNDYTPYSRW